jgi:hypothetical protein
LPEELSVAQGSEDADKPHKLRNVYLPSASSAKRTRNPKFSSATTAATLCILLLV